MKNIRRSKSNSNAENSIYYSEKKYSDRYNINQMEFLRKKTIFKDVLWSIFLKLGLNSNYFSMAFIDVFNDFFQSNIKNIKYYYKSEEIDNGLKKGTVSCIMCTWMEEKMVPYALESSKDFVDRYIIVDKDGTTVPVIKECKDKWDLDLRIYVKPNLSLRESRVYALNKIKEPWVLIQDGDMIFHTDGPNAIHNLRRYMNRPNIVLCSPLNILKGDFHHTDFLIPQLKPHMFFYHNNGSLRAPSLKRDFLIMDGWKIYLEKPYIFNCLIKTPQRMFLRQFWKEWCQDTNLYLKYPDIFDYVTNKLNIDVNRNANIWWINELNKLALYNEEKWGYYPKIIRQNLNMFNIKKTLV